VSGVTVTQFDGPTMRFESVEEYGRWLLSESDAKGDDASVNLDEKWDDPQYGATTAQRALDAMFESYTAPSDSYLYNRAREMGL
jgi:hypothetical protein